MAQPSFSPVPLAGEVRPTMTTQTPELGRARKPGLERSAHRVSGTGLGTPAPGEGYALTIADRECKKLTFEHPEDLHDVIVGVAAVAAKRASVVGRGPTLSDVHVAMDHYGLRATSPVSRATTKHFQGLAHSYAAQRHFVDEVSAALLTTGANGAASSH
ncbi:MAG TPA: hypothetical protein VMV11_01820 [Acidimicrobiales bacterium]|nr:hypothetical protein [Acidimicrobiales bacterium]